VTIFDVLRPALDDAIAPHASAFEEQYHHYRRAFPGTALTRAAGALRDPHVVTAVKKRGQAVAVYSCGELDFVLSAGIRASRIVMHDDGITAAPIRRAFNAGVGRLVLGCRQQVPVMAACAGRPPQVLVDVTTDCADRTIAAVLARPAFDLIGLHAALAPDARLDAYADTAAQMIAQMAHVRREHGIIMTRVSLAGGEVLSDGTAAVGLLRRTSAELEYAFDEGCARYRFPRPALILALQ
jgi:diaminopimelate decarboxylase